MGASHSKAMDQPGQGHARPEHGVRELVQHLACDAPLPVYALVGRDPFLRAEGVEAIRRRALQEEKPGEFVSYSATAIPDAAAFYARLRIQAERRPRRVVAVDDARAFIRRGAGPLIDYLADPPSGSVLVLLLDLYPASPALHEAIGHAGWFVQCTTPDEEELVKWVELLAERHGVALEAGVARTLALYAGEHLARLDAALSGLTDAGDGPLGEADIEPLVAGLPVIEVLDLVAIATTRQREEALALLYGLIGRGVNARYILRTVRRILDDLIRLRDLPDAGAGSDVAPEGVTLRSRACLERLRAQVRCRSMEQLRYYRQLLLEARRDARNGTADLGGTTEKLVVRLCKHSIERSWPTRALHLWIAALAHR